MQSAALPRGWVVAQHGGIAWDRLLTGIAAGVAILGSVIAAIRAAWLRSVAREAERLRLEDERKRHEVWDEAVSELAQMQMSVQGMTDGMAGVRSDLEDHTTADQASFIQVGQQHEQMRELIQRGFRELGERVARLEGRMGRHG